MHSQNQKKTNRKSSENLGVHKNDQNHALPEPKNNNRNLGVHKIEENHALPEPKKVIKKLFKKWVLGVHKNEKKYALPDF